MLVRRGLDEESEKRHGKESDDNRSWIGLGSESNRWKEEKEVTDEKSDPLVKEGNLVTLLIVGNVILMILSVEVRKEGGKRMYYLVT